MPCFKTSLLFETTAVRVGSEIYISLVQRSGSRRSIGRFKGCLSP
ncbi:hypothetical protein HMPREF9554_01704 [Treponema phagedenis F0421]|nr:hypothetical protein HMPREF9554_01704 [Treponema phagedenis F0421]